MNRLIENLKLSKSGTVGLKQYFYDFIEFTKETEFGKGCLITNTANELREDADEKIKEVLSKFTDDVKQVFIDILKQDKTKENATIVQQADF